MTNYVIINGVNSNTINGLGINELPPITKPLQRSLIEEIDGRDGDIITKLGYGAYDKTMTIGLFHTYDINEVIAFFNGEGTITFSNEPDKVYYFTILDQIDYEKLINFKTATITLHCQPFKYPINETPVEIAYQYVEGTGETLTLENTAEAQMQLDLLGNTQQDSTTGKNLLPRFTTGTINGVTLTANQDGSVKINGTASATTIFQTPTTTINSGAYYLSGSTSGSSSTYKLDISSTGGAIPLTCYTQEVNGNIVNTGSYYGRIVVYSGTTVNTTLHPILSTSGGDYEPYTNGASPNPDYPQDIHTCSGDNTIKVEGKNLLNITTTLIANRTNNGITTQVNDNQTITISGTASSTSRYFTSDDNNKLFLKAGTYTISTNSTMPVRLSTKKISGTTQLVADTFTIDEDFYIYNGRFNLTNGTTYNETIWIQLEKGSTATTYEPYTSQSHLISLGVENLFDYSTNTNGKVLASNGAINDDVKFTISDYIKVLPNTKYTISWVYDSSQGSDTAMRVGYYQSDKTFISRPYNTTSPYTITTPNNCYYIRLCYEINSHTQIQTELGSKANSYTPYGTTPIELNKIGTYQDKIYKDNGKWYLHKEIGKVVLNGSENYYEYSISSSIMRYQVRTITDGLEKKPIITNYFKYLGNQPEYSTIGCSFTTRVFLFVNKTDIPTISDLQTWLSTHNTIVYYVLATPTNTEITDTTLLSQLEDLKSAYSYQGTTNISQENNDLPFTINAKALMQGSNTATINNVGNIYSKPTLDIVGNGVVNVAINGNQLLSVNVTDEIVIDSTNLEAYNPTTHELLNRQVTGNIANIKLDPGENTITMSGDLDTATITNYVRWL